MHFINHPLEDFTGTKMSNDQAKALRLAYTSMKEKLLKYEMQGRIKPMFPIATVLDPRFKLEHIPHGEQKWWRITPIATKAWHYGTSHPMLVRANLSALYCYYEISWPLLIFPLSFRLPIGLSPFRDPIREALLLCEPLYFYEYILALGRGPQVGPFPSQPILGSRRGEGTPPPHTHKPKPSFEEKRSELPLKWLLKEDRGRRPTAAAAAAAVAAARPRAVAALDAKKWTPSQVAAQGISRKETYRRRMTTCHRRAHRRPASPPLSSSPSSPSHPPSPISPLPFCHPTNLLPIPPPLPSSSHLPQLSLPLPLPNLPSPHWNSFPNFVTDNMHL